MSGSPTGWNPEVGYVFADRDAPPPPPPPPYAVFGFSPPPPPVGSVPLAAAPFLPFVPTIAGPQIVPLFTPAPQPAPAPAQPPQQPNLPPGLVGDGTGRSMPYGVSYLYPRRHTVLHIIKDGVLPYQSPGKEFRFTIQMAPCGITVQELIDLVGASAGAKDRQTITECVELGDGRWAQGISVCKGDANSKKTLEAMGWDDERASKKQPVWLAVHEA